MGFYINEEINTKLYCEDIFVVQFAINEYLENHNETMDKEVRERMKKLVHRLFQEMYNNPKNDEPNGH